MPQQTENMYEKFCFDWLNSKYGFVLMSDKHTNFRKYIYNKKYLYQQLTERLFFNDIVFVEIYILEKHDDINLPSIIISRVEIFSFVIITMVATVSI